MSVEGITEMVLRDSLCVEIVVRRLGFAYRYLNADIRDTNTQKRYKYTNYNQYLSRISYDGTALNTVSIHSRGN